MESLLKQNLGTRVNKKDRIAYIKGTPGAFIELLELGLTDEHPYAWRAIWLLNHCMQKNDPRLQGTRIEQLLEGLKNKKDGHQREFLKVLEKMDLNDDQEGIFFDVCMTIWEDINRGASVRIVAYRNLIRVAKKYPELVKEIDFLSQDHYVTPLSPGIRNTFRRLRASLQ